MIFYDFEVLLHDWMVVLMDPNKQTETNIINDPEQLSAFYKENKYDVWVGFNCRYYDQYILKKI